MRVSEGKGQAFHLLRISGFSHARKDHSGRDCHVDRHIEAGAINFGSLKTCKMRRVAA